MHFAPFFFFNFGLTRPFRLEPAISAVSSVLADTTQVSLIWATLAQVGESTWQDAASTRSQQHPSHVVSSSHVGRRCDGSGAASVHPSLQVSVGEDSEYSCFFFFLIFNFFYIKFFWRVLASLSFCCGGVQISFNIGLYKGTPIGPKHMDQCPQWLIIIILSRFQEFTWMGCFTADILFFRFDYV